MSERPRKRAKHTRSRLGCRVCRIRRIRCDNTHPACVKCSSTGRQCEWFQDDSSTSWALRPSPSARSSDDPLENRSLQYFRRNTVYHFASCTKNWFWTRLILQVADREPCVRYGIVALGSLHEAFQDEHFSNSRLFPHETPSGQYAWKCYTKAVGLLRERIDRESWQGVDVALLCCLLCVGFEWLRGCYVAAETHLRGGLSVLDQWTEVEQSKEGRLSPSSPTGQLIREQIAPMLSRFALQAQTFMATPVPWTALIVGEHQIVPSPDLKRARDELYNLLSQSYTNTCISQHSNTLFTTRRRKCAWLSRKLSEWYSIHACLLGVGTCEGISLLISYTLIKIMVESSVSTDEMQFDCFRPQFRLIVDLVETLATSGPSKLDVDIEMVPVLYYVVVKCRHPLIRRKAISLLVACPRREGLWDGICTARITQYIVDIEEEGLRSIAEEQDVVAAARVCRFCVWTDFDGRKSWVKFKRQGEQNWNKERVLLW
ncbi:hypothetical protein BDV96DRAFT_136393 [Lophiotrema nucula]|uniref:Zn(2)-C6 fungal-type domain-containing protein n=1 Tax=Lophiotrema nucula TaxID=690887 RepID=A0A6A5ZT39_9PLEO|nr:hypothetical protein BDV96DRAFT_136393 [Lophiotrema nucula]